MSVVVNRGNLHVHCTRLLYNNVHIHFCQSLLALLVALVLLHFAGSAWTQRSTWSSRTPGKPLSQVSDGHIELLLQLNSSVFDVMSFRQFKILFSKPYKRFAICVLTASIFLRSVKVANMKSIQLTCHARNSTTRQNGNVVS